MINRQIWPDEIQPVECLTFERVDQTYIKVLTSRIVLVYIILMCCALIPFLADFYQGWTLIIVEGLLAAILATNVLLVRKIYDIKGYALRDMDVSYRSGLFFTSVTTIPYNKVQQVSVRMNPISRIFGLYYLDIINGSQAAMNQITIPGLTKEKADQLKSLLISNTDSANE